MARAEGQRWIRRLSIVPGINIENVVVNRDEIELYLESRQNPATPKSD
jgi:hypothetical protein